MENLPVLFTELMSFGEGGCVALSLSLSLLHSLVSLPLCPSLCRSLAHLLIPATERKNA